jgi:predicted ATP-grasp superfamily ATP-dependent carboligase
MSNVIVTDGDSRIALAIIRSLARRGYDIFVASHIKDSISFYSRYCKKKIIYPSPILQKKAFVDCILDCVRRGHIDLLIPVTDMTIYPISERLDEFSCYTKVACPEKILLDKVFDKMKTLRIAKQIEVPIPKTYFTSDGVDKLEEVFGTFECPIVIKPRFSCYWQEDKMVYGFRKIVHSREYLIDTFQKMHTKIPNPLVQEYIEGDAYGVSVLMSAGEPLTIFAHKRLREVSINGCVSSFRVSIHSPSCMKEYAVKLLREIKWNGVAMVEFKLDVRDNTPKLMEINGRFWGSLELAISAGVDFPYLLVQLLTGQKVEKIKQYKTECMCRWLRGDIRYALMLVQSTKYTLRYKLKAIAGLLKVFDRKMYYDNLKLHDPLPGLKENIRYLKQMLISVYKGLRK